MGASLVRHVRRVRRGLPHRGVDQQADPRRPDPAAHRARRGRQRVPVLRRRLRAHLLRGPRARRHRVRRGPRPARLAGPAVRQGPVRLGLRRLAAAPDHAADPPRGLLPQGPAVGATSRRRGRRSAATAAQRAAAGEACGADYDEVLPHFREATWEEALDLVARRLTEIHARRRSGRDRRLRLGEVLQRGGLPLPEAHPHRLPHQQRGPLHPAVPRLQRRRAVRGHRLRRGVHDVRRRRQRRRRDRRRQQRDRQPPGRLSLLQAGPAAAARRSSTSTRGPTRWPTTPTSSASSSPAPTSPSTTG